MSRVDDLKDEIEVRVYNGIPNDNGYKEESNWAKFLSFLTPWLVEKRKLGDRLLKAKVEAVEAQNLNILAEANLKNEQANKIAIEAKEIEAKILATYKPSVEDIAEQFEKFQSMMKQCEIIYGMKMEISIELVPTQPVTKHFPEPEIGRHN